jgi:hypothetical protein
MGNNMHDEKHSKNTKPGIQEKINGVLTRLGEDFQKMLEGLNPGRRPMPQPVPIPAPVYRRRRK